MLANSTLLKEHVSRHDIEAKLIECRNKFLGFLRKRLNSAQDAEDVFQDFCIKVLRSHNSIENADKLDAWLGITLRHTLTDHYRRRATRGRGAEAYAIEVKTLEPEAEEVENVACGCLVSAIQKLEPSQAELLTRLDMREESRAAVADDLGVSLNTLGVRVHRSRAALVKKIAEMCPVCGEGQFMQCECNYADGTSIGIDKFEAGSITDHRI
tara:strand:- start:1665 stop:2300 length:636 start_codon:yes stop_codon:yes gene_type:complete